MSQTLLFHATSIANLVSINENGMNPRSYWSNDEGIRDYYVETVEDEGVESSILVIDLKKLQELAEVAGQQILPDLPGIDEPISTVLGRSEEDIQEAWHASDRTWQDSLELIKSIKCPFSIPGSALMVLEPLSDDVIPLADHIADLERHRQRHLRR